MRTDERPDPPADVVDAELLQNRDYVRTVIRSFPPSLIRQVLHAMDDRRRARRIAPEKSAALPELSAAELQREVAWRLETLPPKDAAAIAVLTRRLAARIQ